MSILFFLTDNNVPLVEHLFIYFLKLFFKLVTVAEKKRIYVRWNFQHTLPQNEKKSSSHRRKILVLLVLFEWIVNGVLAGVETITITSRRDTNAHCKKDFRLYQLP